ncbi:hypothetical protein [Cerasicoccus arenae]|uniref:DUF3108 domain-containing protein n=1 Tax=Cerasicoccus arenae TaxID=424488 RepID=A0A8J3GCG0_9BACT|nr:hypothetical protein [Cerasicoccus arenae]MBK1858678.1 hypothetical protein [Cerasicoccus arenae]GHB98265.1 hypothetical protein GCM10007047_12890 [Cerasicoccus arenae]
MKSCLALLGLLPFVVSLNAQIEKYFPIEKGVVWNYQIEKTRRFVLLEGEQVDEISGTSSETIVDNIYPEFTTEGALILQQNVSQKSKMSGGESHDSLNILFSEKGQTVLNYGQLPDGVPFNKDALYSDPSVLIDFNKVKAGEPFQSTMSMKGMKISTTSSDYEYVTLDTALGKLENVLRYKVTGTITGVINSGSQTLNIQDGKIKETNWLAPGIGTVKQEQHMEMALTIGGKPIITSIEDKTKVITSMERE